MSAISPTLSPETIQTLVTKAFVLEATTDKPGCTTRYTDLPGKPLSDFLIAGINVGPFFADCSFEKGIFANNQAALRAANVHKSSKTVNFGLLEIMFPTVVARTRCNDPKRVVAEIVTIMKSAGNSEVLTLLECRKIAWSTSRTSHKLNFQAEGYKDCSSPYTFYERLAHDFPAGNSSHEYANQFLTGLPVLEAFLQAYLANQEYLETTKTVFLEQAAKYPSTAVGILADMCAAALFLYLSFTE